MTGLVRKATLLAAGCLLIGTAAMAGQPSAAHSTLSCINLVGTTAGAADQNAPVTMTIRDASSNPVANSTVVINFTSCTGQDIQLGSSQPDPGTLVNCPAKTISKVTNGSGQVTFRIVGSANNLGNASGHNVGCASIQADGQPMGSVTVAAYDQDLSGIVGVGDLSKFSIDFFGGAYRGRSDYDCTGVVGVGDLSKFSIVFFGGQSSQALSYCAP